MVGSQILYTDPWLVYPLYTLIWIIVGIVIIAAFIAICVYYLNNLRTTGMDDLPKLLWALSFFLLPIFSWIAYYVVVMKDNKK